MPLQEKSVDVQGAKMQVLEGGEGAPLLYLHSFLAESGSIPFIEQLAREFTVYAPAHPGFNRSEGFERIDRIEDLVFHYIDLMEALGLRQALTVGLSFGGWLAAELAVHYPDRVSKLVLIDACGLELPAAPVADIFLANPRELRQLLFHKHDSELATGLLPDKPSAEATLSLYQSRRATARVGWNPYLCDPKLNQRLYRATMPALVVWGAGDRVTPVEHGKTYQRGLAGSRLVTIEDSGHLTALERPDEAAQCVIEFLKN
jgi:pimeloyl-ACP methyl ester carboxylesterase